MNNSTNNINIAEQFSALLDNDLTDAELDALLPQISDSPAVMKTTQRQAAQWNLIGDALRAGIPAETSQPPIANENNVIRPSVWQRWNKPLAGVAVAASVAAVAVLVGQQPDTTNFSSETVAMAPASAVAPASAANNSGLSAAQLRNVVAASNSNLSQMSPFELARMARVDASMNALTPYEPISREELLELQKPLDGEQVQQ